MADVLIVEDDADAADALADVMNIEGHRVRVAFNGEHASVDTSNPATSGRGKTGHQRWRPRLGEVYRAAAS
jgi:hypothetical protein